MRKDHTESKNPVRDIEFEDAVSHTESSIELILAGSLLALLLLIGTPLYNSFSSVHSEPPLQIIKEG